VYDDAYFTILTTAHILLMAPPIECDLGYRFLHPNPNPKSNNNLCSAKRHPNKVQGIEGSVINISYFVGQSGYKRPTTAKRVLLTI